MGGIPGEEEAPVPGSLGSWRDDLIFCLAVMTLKGVMTPKKLAKLDQKLEFIDE